MITVYTPAGMEGWFLEVCTPADDPAALTAAGDQPADRADARGRAPVQRRVGRLNARHAAPDASLVHKTALCRSRRQPLTPSAHSCCSP